ncbi:permease (plasmid) [Legionella adelaidensis]|uniref:Permease n=1 Tax=Legionella adelaidensis TaxID=45056 RepID=A0A0W0R310_9GAMM|nr:LPS export ABC transporter permease LptG [Legionella adelaidensis]KTC65419.1 permease [Legionella adelaidensis]VEH84759.1 permease [Legionella adelaidensis]
MKNRILDRYIAKTILASIGLVTLMLSGLQIFILFVNQLDDLGKANYGFVQAAFFVLLQMPYQVYLFFPMASLLGSLIGLGIMANHRELVVMRAAGMSIGQVTVAVLKAALIVILIVTALSETIVPRLAQLGTDQRLQALSSGQAFRTSKGIWLRYENNFIAVGSLQPNNTLQNVNQFHFDEKHNLQFARLINQVRLVNNNWIASDVAETRLYDDHTETKQIKKMVWEVPLKPGLLNMSGKESEEMTLSELRHFLHDQKMDHHALFSFKLSFWQRIIQPFTTVVMMILAIPFIFGPLRSSTMGSKLLAGATVGFGFHIINRFFGPIGQVFQWPAEVAAFAPTFLFALLGLYLIKRVR